MLTNQAKYWVTLIIGLLLLVLLGFYFKKPNIESNKSLTDKAIEFSQRLDTNKTVYTVLILEVINNRPLKTQANVNVVPLLTEERREHVNRYYVWRGKKLIFSYTK